jgi:hypothetical protein
MNHENSAPEATPSPTAVIIYTDAARFQLGQVVATPGAMELLQQTGFSAATLLNLHVHGDWGDCGPKDAVQNELAIVRQRQLISIYRLVDGTKLAATPRLKRIDLPTIWIITEADRSATIILRPQDY